MTCIPRFIKRFLLLVWVSADCLLHSAWIVLLSFVMAPFSVLFPSPELCIHSYWGFVVIVDHRLAWWFNFGIHFCYCSTLADIFNINLFLIWYSTDYITFFVFCGVGSCSVFAFFHCYFRWSASPLYKFASFTIWQVILRSQIMHVSLSQFVVGICIARLMKRFMLWVKACVGSSAYRLIDFSCCSWWSPLFFTNVSIVRKRFVLIFYYILVDFPSSCWLREIIVKISKLGLLSGRVGSKYHCT